MIVLTKAEVRAALPMDTAIEAAKEAFMASCSGRTVIPLRTAVATPDKAGISLFMPGYVCGLSGTTPTTEQLESVLGVKVVSIFENNPRFGLPTTQAALLLISPATGEPLALMEAGSLTAIRTGAASGVAASLFSRIDSSAATVFGAGAQARTQLEALAYVRPLTKAYVYDVDRRRAQAFAEEMEEYLQNVRPGIRLSVAENPEDAAAEADIIACATTSAVPPFAGRFVRPGTHVNAIGSYTPDRRELDETLLLRASKVVVDSREAVLAEAGDFLIPMKSGVFGPDIIGAEIGEVLLGKKPARESRDEITVYKAVGMAALDLVAAKATYNRALQLGLGTSVGSFS